MRSLLLLSALLLLAACADQGMTAGPYTGSAPAAVDLGSSSRVPHIVGQAGEGEGYGSAQQLNQPTARQVPVASATTENGKPMPAAASPPASQGEADHSHMDHSKMDHSGAPAPGSGGQQ